MIVTFKMAEKNRQWHWMALILEYRIQRLLFQRIRVNKLVASQG